ncbi:M56 family metallopeptidase [Terrimonas ferruginea]|uniref:M56 family metallopeptidase n=1 Tax=Terrimonas ferruginea TaxID=249 RepID=UPI0004921064|nr:M56 family metallopeptidase [Terrimonas ferruginea]
MFNDFLHLLSWMLIHSLWIGAVIFILTVAGLILTRRASAASRYNVLIALLMLFIAGIIAACFFTFRSTDDLIVSTGTGYYTPVRPAIGFVDQYAVWIVSLWAVFVVFKLFRLYHNVYGIRQLRRYSTPLINKEWKQVFSRFTSYLTIGKSVLLAESAKIKAPVTIGHFKPMIIVPAGFFSQLPYVQIEAILFHELAHIYRRDYLVNALQHFAGALFFFNPAFVWLSRLIRQQREICCDDLVLFCDGNKTGYLKGLLAFGFADNSNHFALSAKGSPLARRLHRLIDKRNETVGLLPKLIVLMLLLAIPFTLVLLQDMTETALVGKNDIQHVLKYPAAAPAKVVRTKRKIKPAPQQDTTFRLASIRFEKSNEDMANRIMMVKDEEGNTYHLRVEKSELVALSINDNIIPENELTAHLGLFARIDDAWNKRRAAKAAYMAKLNL